MRALPPTLTAIAIAAALTGCGGSAKPSASACWTNAYKAEVAKVDPSGAGQKYANTFAAEIGGHASQSSKNQLAASVNAVDVADAQLLLTSVKAHAANVKLPAWLPSYIKPWLHQTQQKCGSLPKAAGVHLKAGRPVAHATFRLHDIATSSEQAVALNIARRYWAKHAPAGDLSDGHPRCGQLRLQWASFGIDDVQGASAEAYPATCVIIFNTLAWQWPSPGESSDIWPAYCTAMAHEYGHLVLGLNYFAKSNPSDPEHSPEPKNLMYKTVIVYLPACMHTPDPSY